MNTGTSSVQATGYEHYSKEELIAELISLKSANGELKFKVLRFESELTQLKRMIFGSKSERFEPSVSPEQLALDLGIEATPVPPAPTETITYTREKKKKSNKVHTGRTPLPSHLPRIEIIIEPEGDVSGLKCIGKEITEELEFTPGKFYVNQYIRPKYVKPQGEATASTQANGEPSPPEQNGQSIIIGSLPSRPIEKGIPGPGLLANILIDKYQYHTPCYRQIQKFKREGVIVAPSTISEWIRESSNLIAPLGNVLSEEVLAQHYLQADETPIKVLDKDKKGAAHLGFYWVYHAPEIKMVLFDYRRGRSRDGPNEILRDFRGRLQTDAYKAYESLDNDLIILFNCMAHARRKFDEALDNDKARAEYVLVKMQMLYAIERYARENNLSHQERQQLREKDAKPILEELRQWFKDNLLQVTPQSKIGKAIMYSYSRWDKLCLYVQDGSLEIDNNLIENTIRPIALGRKNYLFAGSHDAAQRAAIIYSLIGTCKLRGVEPYEWLRHVLTVIPDYKANQLHQLLPGIVVIPPQPTVFGK